METLSPVSYICISGACNDLEQERQSFIHSAYGYEKSDAKMAKSCFVTGASKGLLAEVNAPVV